MPSSTGRTGTWTDMAGLGCVFVGASARVSTDRGVVLDAIPQFCNMPLSVTQKRGSSRGRGSGRERVRNAQFEQQFK